MKKIDVNKDLCIGCGACVAIDPEHFEFDDDGKSEVISNENLDKASLVNAIESCPTSAISMVDSSDTEEEKDCTCEDDNSDCKCEHCHENCSHEE